MNKKLNLLLLVILGLFLAALMSKNSALVWMSLPFLCYLFAGMLSTPQEFHLGVSRTISHHRCEAGTTITMTILVNNNGESIPHLQIHESISPKICLLSRVEEYIGFLSAGGKAELQYSFQAPRGRYNWKKTQLTVGDPFGLFTKTIEFETEIEVLVLPEQLSVKLPQLNLRHTLRAPGLYLSRLPGSGVNFFGVRKYHPGDPLRWIHWRLSARHPKKFFTKEFEREEMADICLILDGNASLNLHNDQGEIFEHAIKIAATLSKSILQAGNRLSMLLLGERVERIFPGAGKFQLVRVLDHLAACQPGENVSLNTLKYLPVRLFPSHALIVLITTLRSEDMPAITRLLANKYQVILVSPDPVKFVYGDEFQLLSSRIASIERKTLHWRLRGMGIQMLDWPINQQMSINRKNYLRNIMR